MLKTKTTLSLLLALIAGSMMFPASAIAGTADTQSYNVRYNPSELGSAEKASAIIDRVHATATELCLDEMGPERYIEKLKVQRCLREVTQDFVDRIGHPNLDAAHRKNPAPRKLIKGRSHIQLAGSR